MKRKPIVIDVYESKNELVRLRPKASELVKQVQRETGLSASCIVSQIIEKAIEEYGVELNFVSVKEVNDLDKYI